MGNNNQANKGAFVSNYSTWDYIEGRRYNNLTLYVIIDTKFPYHTGFKIESPEVKQSWIYDIQDKQHDGTVEIDLREYKGEYKEVKIGEGLTLELSKMNCGKYSILTSDCRSVVISQLNKWRDLKQISEEQWVKAYDVAMDIKEKDIKKLIMGVKFIGERISSSG